MIRRRVIFAPEARHDLLLLYDWIADAASPATALAYTERVETFLRGLDLGPERGTPRDDVRPGLRIIAYRRRITIAFTVDPERVTILRLFYGGRDWGAAMSTESDEM